MGGGEWAGHGIFYMPSRIDEAGHTKAFESDYPVAEHWGKAEIFSSAGRTRSDNTSIQSRSLEERFGDVFLIKGAYRDKIAKWPKVGANYVYELRDFSDFLFATSSAMPHIAGLELLDDCEETRKILENLPEWVVKCWNRVVVEKVDGTRTYPDFNTFVQFLMKETRVVCNPICSPFLLKSSDERGKSSTRETKRQILVIDALEETTWAFVVNPGVAGPSPIPAP